MAYWTNRSSSRPLTLVDVGCGMALKSEAFRGDPRLEAAAVSDPAHVVPGSVGDHVAKIQRALNRLDGARLDVDGVYGSATAAAVFAFKTGRNLVNRSYQASADNIVGKMTMAALDEGMAADESTPLVLQTLYPAPRPPSLGLQGGLRLGFAISLAGFADLAPSAVPNLLPTTPPSGDIDQIEVIIPRTGFGTFQVVLGNGSTVSRVQRTSFFWGRGKNDFQVAALRGAKQKQRDREDLDILQDLTTVTYEALACGETFFSAWMDSPKKTSKILRVLSLVEKATPMTLPPGDYSPDPVFTSGLMSKAGTPLNPRPGRKINIFGEGESAGFEEYSTDIDYCSHGFSNGNGPAGVSFGNRPWTNDPRKPPGIADHSVDNLCCRGSPIKPVTIQEILRIGKSGCRVTYYEGGGQVSCNALKAGLKGATVVEEHDTAKGGRGIILEMA